jgi:uncharacterized lipoprotein YddW (UPF0748 family)
MLFRTVVRFLIRRGGLVPALLILSISISARAQTDEFRALWVDAFGTGFKNASDVTALVNNARAGNFNVLIVQVRKRGDAYYNGSPYEPKATDISPSSFDPLQDIINKAHDTSGGKQRIEVHTWITTYPISTTASPGANHPMTLHPDWVSQAANGTTFDGFNYWFEQAHPGVQEHTFNVAMDIISRYNIDGFNLDYIRYNGQSWGYNPVAIQRFNFIYNRTGTPTTTDTAWLQFRRDQVTALVRKIYLSTMAIKPHVKISVDAIAFAPGVTTTSQWPNTDAYKHKMQDWRAWMEEGMIDITIPMMYFNQEQWASAWNNWSIFTKNHRYNRHAVLGPALYLNTVSNSIYQIRTSRTNTAAGNKADGISGYAYKQISNDGTPRSTFLAALTQPATAALYDPYPAPVFFEKVNPPVMPWKTSPTRGHLKGFVRNTATGGGLDYATVTLTGPANRTLRTDATGFYGAVDLPPGAYTLNVSFAGYTGASSNATVSVGAVTTRDFNLNQTAVPTIVQQPQSQSVLLGNDATFTVIATGNPAPSYQWRFSGTNIAGATASSYTRANVNATHTGNYSVVVSNSLGSVTSSNAALTIVSFDSPPVITTYPQSQTVRAGSNVTFTASAQGTAPLNFQWQRNGINLPGETNLSLTLAGVQPANAGQYTVTVANNAGSDTSWAATLAVHYGLDLAIVGNGTISKSPDLPLYPPNSTVSLTASTSQFFGGWSGSASGIANPLVITMNGNKNLTATFSNESVVDDTAATVVGTWSTGTSAGYYNLGYRWKGIGTGASYLQFTPNIPTSGNYQVYTWHVPGGNRTTNAPHVISYSGGTQTVFVNQKINGSQWILLGTFPFAAGTSGHVRITDGFSDSGQVVMADAIRFVSTAAPTPLPPMILTQPQGRSVIAGQSAMFTVNATGPGTLSYQWRHAGTNISGATASSYTRVNAQAVHAGNYSVVVGNANGSTTSSNAALTVNVPVAISSQPQSQTNNPGASVNFNVTPSGTAPLGYRWRFNGMDIPGATTSTLALTDIQSSDEGIYSVVINNIAGGLASSNATLTVTIPPVITSHPQDQTVDPGHNVFFGVIASGTAPLNYQWQRDGTNIAAATASSFAINNVQPSDAAVYTVIVSNDAGSETSDPAILTVNSAPSILAQPQSQTVDEGTNVTFSVIAAGTEPLTYQWRFNETNIAGANDPDHTLLNAQPGNAGSYSVIVSNHLGFVISSNAVLTINPGAVIQFDSIVVLPDGIIQLRGSAVAGNYAIDSATNLGAWTELSTFSVTNGGFEAIDPATNQVQRFYRARKLD